MKAVLQNFKTGELAVEETPPPALKPYGILVRVRRSLISLGTERAIIALAKKGPLGKARDRPDLARKVINKARQEGYWSTYKVVSNLIASPIPLGYSTAGEVIAVGAEATNFSVGDRVACAGLNIANHAEVNYIPRNMAVKIPRDLSYDSACFITVGAIAMQGVRLAELTLGDRVVVLGLGLVGQIAAQLARCAGATVLATDIDSNKVELARKLGCDRAVASVAELQSAVDSVTAGQGADAVLICASTSSNDLIRIAPQLTRLKGRVVAVGDVGMHIERRPYYDKEIQLVISRSYGPGRYDTAYENRGVDYPLPYVRWTQGRNMESFLELAARKDLDVESLITHRFPIDKGEEAYRLVTGEVKEPTIAIVLDYTGDAPIDSKVIVSKRSSGKKSGDLRIGVIGAGQFAKGVLLPAFESNKGVQVRAVCTASGLTSKRVAERYGSAFCTSDPEDILADDSIDVVVIATRHDQHATLAGRALLAGKSVFLEKPLAINPAALAELLQSIESLGSAPPLMVGFNRRFSPLAVKTQEFFQGAGRLYQIYRVNAGVVPPDSWVSDPVEGGGRIVGEVCHFVDFALFLAGDSPQRVFAERIAGASHENTEGDGLAVTLRLEDGSLSTIHYLSDGDSSLPKERLEVSGGQRSAVLDNYRTLSLHSRNRRRVTRLFNQSKGHIEMVRKFLGAVRQGEPMPIDFDSILAVTESTFAIARSLETGVPENILAPEAALSSD